MNSQPAFNHRVMGSYIVDRKKEKRKDREKSNQCAVFVEKFREYLQLGRFFGITCNTQG
jgi:hypothetical protein